MTRKTVTDVLEVVGLALIVAGVTLIRPVAGLIAAGVAFVLVGVLVS